jgi:hypothetical protein
MPLSPNQRAALTLAATKPHLCYPNKAFGSNDVTIKQVTLDSLRRAGLIEPTTGNGHIATRDGLAELGHAITSTVLDAALTRWEAHKAARDRAEAARAAVRAAADVAGLSHYWVHSDSPADLRRITKDHVSNAEARLAEAQRDLDKARAAADKAEAALRAAGL